MTRLPPAIVGCIVACFAALSALPAMADDIEDIRKCAAESDGVLRLACFDDIAARLQSAADTKARAAVVDKAAAAEKLIAAMSAWETTVEKSKIDDSTNVYIHVPAKDEVRISYRMQQPTFWIRCLENKTSAILNFDDGFVADIEGYGEVTFRVDKKPALKRALSASTDNHALGLWSGGAAIPFIKTLFGGQSLVVRATPFNESGVLMEFNIAEIEQAVAPVRKACGW